MKTTFDLPDQLIRQAKSLAAQQGRPLRELVAEAISEKLHSSALRTPGGKLIPVGRREGRRETWEEWKSHLVQQPDGTWLNTDAIDDPAFFEYIDSLRREHHERRNPFEDQK
jgi:hypothetical protein